MSQGSSGVPAGWYPDPWGNSRRRYWDGHEWTAHLGPAQTVAPPATRVTPQAAPVAQPTTSFDTDPLPSSGYSQHDQSAQFQPAQAATAGYSYDGQSPNASTGDRPGPAYQTVPATAFPQPVDPPKKQQSLGPVSIVVFVLAGLIVIAWQLSQLGVGPFIFGSLAALIPLPVYLLITLAVDRFRPEPPRTLAWTFLCGATVVALGSLAFETVFGIAASSAFDEQTVGSLGAGIGAPFIEEGFKASILLVLFFRSRERFNGPLDGMLYAAMVGFGFAMAENVAYYGAASHQGSLAAIVILRGLASPFSHPLYTSMTGIGLGMAAMSKGARRYFYPPLGYAVAVGLHATWNGSAILFHQGFFLVFLFFMVPVFIAWVTTAVVCYRREKAVVRTQLRAEVEAGTLTNMDLNWLASVKLKRNLRHAAQALGGVAGKNALRDLDETALDLAFLRRRLSLGLYNGNGQAAFQQAEDMRQQLIRLRTLLPAPPPQAPATGIAGALGLCRLQTVYRAGWYPDPSNPQQRRWWDGTRWAG